MWRSGRKSRREIDNIDGSVRRSLPNLNFIHSSLKDVENLFADDDKIGFDKTLGQPSPCSTTATTTRTTARRLSVFHRVHLASKFTRAFSTNQSPSSNKFELDSNKFQPDSKRSLPDSNKYQPDLNIFQPDSNKILQDSNKFQPDSNIFLPDSNKSQPDSTKSQPDSNKSQPDSNKLQPYSTKSQPDSKSTKSDRLISIPGAEKRVVLYTTSLHVVRPTFEACRTVQSILRTFRVSIDERDLSMDSKFLNELQNIMAEEEDGEDDVEKTKLALPRVFIGGRYIGGAEEVKQLHETGELKKFVDRLPAVTGGVCQVCGDFRFVLCDECSGSHKCYSEKGGFRSCTLCNENGLIRCSSCLGS